MNSDNQYYTPAEAATLAALVTLILLQFFG